ncbi:MAG: glutathione S-transferase family protein [Cyanobacteria bacterium P01_D01_bin.105]
MQLVIGNKNYSSWSLRPWMLLSFFKLDFEEVQASLKAEGLSARLGQFSPTSRVPVLIDGELTVWDSLAICEYVSERYLEGKGWPRDVSKRAEARAVTAEMHSGFAGLRREMPMNCRARRRVEASAQTLKDIARVDEIWAKGMADSGGPWLFGAFSIVDCFYAPVVMRFATYAAASGVTLSAGAQRYQDFFLQNDVLQAWVGAAKQETEIVPEDEAGDDSR